MFSFALITKESFDRYPTQQLFEQEAAPYPVAKFDFTPGAKWQFLECASGIFSILLSGYHLQYN